MQIPHKHQTDINTTVGSLRAEMLLRLEAENKGQPELEGAAEFRRENRSKPASLQSESLH